MTLEDKQEAATEILTTLYDAWTGHRLHRSLLPLQQEHGWEQPLFETVLDYLENYRGFITGYGNAYTYDISPNGILYAEQIGLIDSHQLVLHEKAREHILEFLAQLFELKGIRGDAHYSEICKDALQNEKEMLIELGFLKELGWIESTSTSSFRITYLGLDGYLDGEYNPQLI